MTRHLTLQAAIGYVILALFCFVSLLPIWMATAPPISACC